MKRCLGVASLSITAGAASPGLVAFAPSGVTFSVDQANQERLITSPPGYVGSFMPRGWAVASLDSQGSIMSMTDPIHFTDDFPMPGCNAGFDAAKKQFIKTTFRKISFEPSSGCESCGTNSSCCKDPTSPGDKGACYDVIDCSKISEAGGGGDILTIDVQTGNVARNVTMTGAVSHPVFGAVDPATGLMYSVNPYTQQAIGVFSYDTESGNVQMIASYPKGKYEGISACQGLVWQGKLVYQAGGKKNNYLTVFDLQSKHIVNRAPGHFALFTPDPLNSDRLIAIDSTRGGPTIFSVDPLHNTSEQIFKMNTTLGKNLRVLDQPGIAMDPAGNTLWVVAEYNDAKGELYHAIFTIELAVDRSGATLKSENGPLFSDGEGFGRMDYTLVGTPLIV